MPDHTLLPPALADYPKVTSHAELFELLTSRGFEQGGYDESADFLKGTIAECSGEAHVARHRIQAGLFRREALQHYETEVLIPSIERQLEAGEVADDGRVHDDLVQLARRILTQ